MAIELYSHNKDTYDKMLEMFKSGNRVGVVQPTGTGKSFLYLKWIEDHPQEMFVVLSPSMEIFAQLREYAEAAGCAGILDGVQMVSYQALLQMSDEEISQLHSGKMILDEFHRTGAEQWGPALQKLLDVNSYAQVLGASATPVRYLDDSKDMAAELFDRNLAVEMTLGEAVRRDILPTPKYVPVWYDIDGKMAQYERDISKIKNKEERKELEEKLGQVKRKLENAYGAEDIFEKNMDIDHGKFIVFCRDKEHLEEMKKTVPQWLTKVNKNVRSYVSVSAQGDKDFQLQAFKDDKGEDAVKLLFTVDRLNEGLHVKGIDGVIMLRPTVSPIIYLQQMGRALSASGKNPLIFDMVNNYQNVQIPLGDGVTQNVFEAEFKGNGNEEDVGDFRIFEDMVGFEALFEQLEDSLYLSNDEIWEKRFQQYVDFKEEFGREPSRTDVFHGVNIGGWCHNQKNAFKSGLLVAGRIQKLESVGFSFDLVRSDWQSQFDRYIAYKKAFGKEPGWKTVYGGVNLGDWCSRQRKDFVNGELSAERIEKLQQAGFVFKPYDKDWQRQFDAYVAYRKVFGCEPAKNTIYNGVNIWRWSHGQRQNFKNGKLSGDRVEQLKSIGFVFDPFEQDWQRQLALYLNYKREFGEEPTQSTVYKGESLGTWCSTQRKAFQKGKLSDERLQKLQSVGFVFDRYEQDWQSKFDLYVAYKKEFGREPLANTEYQGVKIGVWCSGQMASFKDGKMTQEHMTKLTDAGFCFEGRKRASQGYDCGQKSAGVATGKESPSGFEGGKAALDELISIAEQTKKVSSKEVKCKDRNEPLLF